MHFNRPLNNRRNMSRTLGDYYFETVIEHFPRRSIYENRTSKRYMMNLLKEQLLRFQRECLEEYEEFKGKHGQTEDEKEIAKKAKKVIHLLEKMYKEIGNEVYGVSRERTKMKDTCAVSVKKNSKRDIERHVRFAEETVCIYF